MLPEEDTVSPVSAEAPGSEYESPNSTVAGLLPFKVITGAVESLSPSSKEFIKRPAARAIPTFCNIVSSSAMAALRIDIYLILEGF